MTTKHSYKIVIILRILFFLIGAIIGYVAMWQILNSFTVAVGEKWFVIFQISAAILLGIVLCLSTKAIMTAGHAIGSLLKRIFTVAKPVKIAGVIIGIIIGAMAAYLTEAVLSLVLNIYALRIVIDVIVALIVSFLGAIACIKWLENSETEVPVYDGGYVVAPSALEDDRIVVLLSEWLQGDKVILLSSVNELIKVREESHGKKSLVNYEKLIASATIRVVDGEKNGIDGIVNYSLNRRMKIIAKNKTEFLNETENASDFSVLALDDLTL